MHKTLCGNCGTDHSRALDGDLWVTVTDWRRDVLCPKCRASYLWDSLHWHILMTHDGRLLGYVRLGALPPGRHVIMHTAFSGNIAGIVVCHHTNTPDGEWNGISRVMTNAGTKQEREYDCGTITLEPVPS